MKFARADEFEQGKTKGFEILEFGGRGSGDFFFRGDVLHNDNATIL